MKLKVLKIDNRVVTLQFDTGLVVDVARRWFTEDIQEEDSIELNINTDMIKDGGFNNSF